LDELIKVLPLEVFSDQHFNPIPENPVFLQSEIPEPFPNKTGPFQVTDQRNPFLGRPIDHLRQISQKKTLFP
jgi:hypothetical protein